MWASNVKWDCWYLALHKDPKAGIFKQRIAAKQVGDADTFNNFQLKRLNYRPATTEELTFARASVNDRFLVWTIYQVDLDYATPVGPTTITTASLPMVDYQLQVVSNAGVTETWNIEQVLNENLMVSYDCLSRWVPQGP